MLQYNSLSGRHRKFYIGRYYINKWGTYEEKL